MTINAKAILWDLDGTLVDSEPAHRASFALAVDELGLPLPDNFEQRVLGTNERYVYELLKVESGLDLNLADWRALKWRHFEQSAPMIKRRAASQQSLIRAGELKLPMAIVTNSTADELALNLRATRLPKVFGAMVSGQDVSAPKPEPEGYQLAAARLAIEPQACIVVEDSLPGTRAGLAAGMRTILFPQHDVDKADRPQGAYYLAPEACLWALLKTFL